MFFTKLIWILIFFNIKQVYVFSGGSDRIVTPLVIKTKLSFYVIRSKSNKMYQIFQDVDWLLTQLGNLKGSTRLSDYNHADFLWVKR
jgi:lysosomal acid lipase/cholesteryl ester hydrolase